MAVIGPGQGGEAAPVAFVPELPPGNSRRKVWWSPAPPGGPPPSVSPPPPPGVWIPPPRPGPSCSTRRSVVSPTPPAPCTLLSHILLFTFFVCLFYPFRLRPLLSLLSYPFLASLSHFFLFFFPLPLHFPHLLVDPPPLAYYHPFLFNFGFYAPPRSCVFCPSFHALI